MLPASLLGVLMKLQSQCHKKSIFLVTCYQTSFSTATFFFSTQKIEKGVSHTIYPQHLRKTAKTGTLDQIVNNKQSYHKRRGTETNSYRGFKAITLIFGLQGATFFLNFDPCAPITWMTSTLTSSALRIMLTSTHMRSGLAENHICVDVLTG